MKKSTGRTSEKKVITKPSKSQVKHIQSPFVDKSDDKAKQGTVKNTVKSTEKKYGGNAKIGGIKLKRGK